MTPSTTNFSEISSIQEMIGWLRDRYVPEAEYGRYFNIYLESKARKQRIPLTGHFELTPLCNLDCRMCYIHLKDAQFDRSSVLPAQEWKEIMSEAHRMGMLRACLTGGECLLHPGFDEIYLHLYQMGIRPGLLSNGILLTENKIDLFKRYPPEMIQVTMYGCSEEEYERVTGYRVFHTVYENLIRLREAEIPVKLSYTPNEFMSSEYEHLISTLTSLKIPFNINANLIQPRENTGRALHDASLDAYVALYRLQSSNHQRILEEIDPVEIPDEGRTGEDRFGLPCGAGKSAFTIRYDGKMCPCSSLGELTVDMQYIGFEAAWKKTNELANHYQMPQECGDCALRSRCLSCAAMHKNASAGHCDRRICERTKKLIAAGLIPLPEKHKE